jgi:glycerol-1-phosphate dehydrogenase [NAD(P)+]
VQNHRFQRITKVFTDTGFFDYAKTLKMKKEDYIKAIDMAPSIKPQRYTYMHVEEYRETAKKLVMEDEVLNSILI